ncbi:MAG: HAD-IIA family hydrolase [Planctomycetes bacterium]|nr:HAD-IIA family hydrolase [Planctomycetota bacterium]
MTPAEQRVTGRLAQTRCFLLDMDGTFYLGDRLLEGSLHFIELIRQQGRQFVFLTNNSSKNRQEYIAKITGLGLPIAEDQVFTSGEATALYLKAQHAGARLFVLGTPGLEAEFREHGFALVEEDPDMVVLGFDTTLTYNKLWKVCDFVRAGRPYLATHGDLNCPTADGFMPDIGAIIAFIYTSTGRKPDEIIGKPNRTIIDMLAHKLNLPIESLTMVGDRLYTDIALGGTSGINTVLVLSGETKQADLEGSPYRPDAVFENLGALANWLEINGGMNGA